MHVYTLVYLVILTDKAKRFDQALHPKVCDKERPPQDKTGGPLPNNIFMELPARPPDIPGIGGWLSTFAWATLEIAPVLLLLLVFAPLFLLLLMQIQFLPYHSAFVTWTDRLALVADLTLVALAQDNARAPQS